MKKLIIGIAALATSVIVANACIKDPRDEFNKRLNETWLEQYQRQQDYYERCKELNERIKNL